MKIRFGLLQYPIYPNPGKTFIQVIGFLKRATFTRPHYILLPEMWLGAPQKKTERAQWALMYRQVLEDLCRWCGERKIGCFLSQLSGSRGRYYNTAYFIERDGKIKGSYHKIHLFSLGGENKIYTAGKKIGCFSSTFGKVGCVICYDIRFPELTGRLVDQGMKILAVPAQWPEIRADHWLTLLKARAIENQCYVVAVNRLGKKGALRFGGHSVVFDPWGKCLLHLSDRHRWGICTLDLSLVDKIRKAYPFLAERENLRIKGLDKKRGIV